MSKLKIPASTLMGNPLTDEEMKSILGGSTTYSCSCKWENGKGQWRAFEIEYITSQEQCMTACADWCTAQNASASEPSCYDTKINFSVTTS